MRLLKLFPDGIAVALSQEDSLVALELRRRGDSHSESLHLMRQTPSDVSDVDNSNKSEKAGMGARVRNVSPSANHTSTSRRQSNPGDPSDVHVVARMLTGCA